jgi:hypothetical protein
VGRQPLFLAHFCSLGLFSCRYLGNLLSFLLLQLYYLYYLTIPCVGQHVDLDTPCEKGLHAYEGSRSFDLQTLSLPIHFDNTRKRYLVIYKSRDTRTKTSLLELQLFGTPLLCDLITLPRILLPTTTPKTLHLPNAALIIRIKP